MKRTALLLATAAMAMTSTLASAQSYGGYRNDRGDNGRYEQRNDRGGQTWRQGQRLDQRYRSRDRMVSNYSSYRLRAPPRGYSYYRQDNGDILLAAIATGLIASIISGNNGGIGTQYGYNQPGYGGGYAQPGYGGGYGAYGGAQVYHDQYGRAYTIDQYGRSVWVR